MKYFPSLIINNFLNQTPLTVKLGLRQGGSLIYLSVPRLKTGVRRACFHSEGNERFSMQYLVTPSARTTGIPNARVMVKCRLPQLSFSD